MKSKWEGIQWSRIRIWPFLLEVESMWQLFLCYYVGFSTGLVRKGERDALRAALPYETMPLSWSGPRWQLDTAKGLVYHTVYHVLVSRLGVGRAPTSPLGPTSFLKSCINKLPGFANHEAVHLPGPHQEGNPTSVPSPPGNHLPTLAPLSAFPSGQGLMSILFPLTVSDCTQPWKPWFVPVALTNQ